ncbi:hypothetical protein ACLOJK_032462, partial [Asimina triloba]
MDTDLEVESHEKNNEANPQLTNNQLKVEPEPQSKLIPLQAILASLVFVLSFTP